MDFGPGFIPADKGPVLLGASPWVLSCNAVLNTTDMDMARRVARGVAAKGGGLSGVEVSRMGP